MRTASGPFLTTHTHTYIYSLTLESSKLKPEVFPPYPAISSAQDKTPCFRTQSQGFHGRLGHPMDRGQGRSYRADVGTDPLSPRVLERKFQEAQRSRGS